MELGRLRSSEAFLRVSAIVSLILTASLLVSDNQTKEIFYIKKKATFRSLEALKFMVYVDSVAAGYNLLQLCKFLIPAATPKGQRNFNLYFYWLCFLLDQAAVYMTFAANSAGLEASLLAVTGAQAVQWMKLCNKYSKFCAQVGGSLLCGYLASLLMALISFLSAFNLFRHYSPKYFLQPKPK